MAAPEEHEMAEYEDIKPLDPPKADEDIDDESKHAEHFLRIKSHWGLPRLAETVVFYTLAILGWMCLIAAAALGSYRRTSSHSFISTASAGLFLHWAAWAQTAFAMFQRASWRREETLVERVQFLFFAIRLQRLMIVRPFMHALLCD